MTQSLIAKYDARVPRYTSYPTAPHFQPTVDGEVYADWLAALPPEEPLSLYLHIPFCDTLCWFCGCHTTVVNKPAPVTHYLETLLAEIALLAERLPGRFAVSHLHFGGGSPTILSPEQIERLFATLREHFDIGPEAEVAVEIDPRGLGEDVIAAFARCGMTRASIGVQDLDPAVQRSVNRIQPFETTAHCVELLRRHGVRSLNLDLMYGLPHQSVEGTAETMRRILTLAPDRVALFGYAHVPWMKKHMQLIEESALPDSYARWAQFEAAAAELDAEGYQRIGLDHFARLQDSMAVAQREGGLRRNFQGYTTDEAAALVGLGASAIGKLPQGYVQNAANVRDYAEAVQAGRLPTLRGVALTPEDRLRAEAIERLMCDLSVDLAAVAERHGFGFDIFEGALAQLAGMQADGLLEIEGAQVRVNAQARPLLRAVAAVFDGYLDGAAGRHAKAV